MYINTVNTVMTFWDMPMTEAQGAPIPELCSAPWWWSSGCLQPMEGIEGILETGDLSRFRKKLGPLETWMVWQNSQLWPIPRCKLQKPRQTENRWDRGGRMVWQLFCRFVGHLILSSCIVLKVRVQYSWRMLVCAHGCIYVFYHILSYFIIFYHTLSYFIIFYDILSYFIIFYHILSYFINVHHFWCRLGRGQLATPLASLGPGDDGRGQAMESPGGY